MLFVLPNAQLTRNLGAVRIVVKLVGRRAGRPTQPPLEPNVPY